MILNNLNFIFFFNNILLGIALAMDAFSVSIANGLHEKNIKTKKVFLIAGIFAFFQGLMPLIGWICVHTLLEKFQAFSKFIPWIALVLLSFLGIKMIVECIKKKEDECAAIGFLGLLVQGIATSIDALSVGFTIAELGLPEALISVLIIAVITFIICFAGVFIGKLFGNKFSNKAELIGGIILIIIGLEIFLTNIL